MDASAEAARLDALRRRRAFRPRRDALADAFTAAARELERSRRRLAGVAEAWEAVCPPGLVERTAIEGVARGVLTIRVADASTRFELDRLLRTGAEAALVGLAPSTIRRVRLALA